MRSILGALLITWCWFVSLASAQITGRVETIGYDGDYRPGCWTPMVVRISPNGAPTGFYELRVWQHDLDGDLPYYSTKISLTGTASEQPFWTYFIPEPIHEGLTSDTSTAIELQQRLRVTIHDAAGRELAQIPLADPRSGATAKMHSIEQPGVGNAPARPWRFVLFIGTKVSPALSQYEQKDIVGIKENLSGSRIDPDNLPENVIGYDGVDAIVWLDGDPATLNSGGGARFDALREYVRRGGHLVITTPANWQQLNGFGDLLPVDISGTEGNILQSPLRELTAKILYPEGAEGLPARNPWLSYRAAQQIAIGAPRTGAIVDEYSNRIPDAVEAKDRTPWLVRRAFGFGCVSWVAQDLAARDLVDRANWGWPAVWELVLGAETTPVVEPKTTDKRRFMASGQRDYGFGVIDAMNLTGRGATLVTITVLFFIVYWALAGPGAFFWLKYKRRSTLNWFAFGTVALVATGVTLGVVKLVLRGKPEVRHISLVRVDGDRAKPSDITSRIGMYIPRDGAQRIEVPATPESATGIPPTITPYPIHPALHHHKDGDKYLFAAPREYRVGVPTDESARDAVADVPFRTTMKRLEARWSGATDERVEGSASLEPSVGNVGYISGTLKNLTGRDLRNVYIAFRHEPRGGTPREWMMFVYGWNAGDTLDLGKAFNPQGEKTPTDITVSGGEKRIGPNREFPVRGWLTQWMEFYVPFIKANSLGDLNAVSDLNDDVPLTVPLVSFYNRLPVVQNAPTGAGTFENGRAELLRSGLRDWDVSNALMAGRLVIVAQADQTPLPLPLTVDGDKITGAGRTIYQFILPLAPLPEEPTTRPTSAPTTKASH